MNKFLDLVEQQVQAAQRRGEMDNLPGQGRPLIIDQFDNLFQRTLKNSGEIPPELALLKEHNELHEQIQIESDPKKKRALQEKWVKMESRVQLGLERLRKTLGE